MDDTYRFFKNETEEVRFSLRPYKDKLFFDIRLFFRTKDGEFVPTRKGITLATNYFGEFGKGMAALARNIAA